MTQLSENVDAWFVFQPVSGGNYYECQEDAEWHAERLNRGLTRHPGQKEVREHPYLVRQFKVRADDPNLISKEQANAEHADLPLSRGRNEQPRPPSPSPSALAGLNHNGLVRPERTRRSANKRLQRRKC